MYSFRQNDEPLYRVRKCRSLPAGEMANNLDKYGDNHHPLCGYPQIRNHQRPIQKNDSVSYSLLVKTSAIKIAYPTASGGQESNLALT